MYVLLLIKGSTGMREIFVNQDEHTALGECALCSEDMGPTLEQAAIFGCPGTVIDKWSHSSSTGDQALSPLMYVDWTLIRS